MARERRGSWLVAGALCVGVLLGCGKRSADASGESQGVDPAAAASQAAAVASASASPAAAAAASGSAPRAAGSAAAPRSQGLVGAHLPADCPEGRIYADVQGLLAISGLDAKVARERLLIAFGAEAKAGPALARLASSGLDLPRDLRELALCARGGDDVLLVADVELGRVKGELHELIAQAASASGGRFTKQSAKGLNYVALEGENGVLGQAGPTLLLAAKDLAAFEAAQRPSARGSADLTGYLAVLELASNPQSRVRITAREQGETIRLEVTMPMSGPAAAELAREPKRAVAQLQALLDAQAKRLAKTSYGALAAEAKQVRIVARDQALVAILDLSRPRARELVAAAMAGKPEELLELLR